LKGERQIQIKGKIEAYEKNKSNDKEFQYFTHDPKLLKKIPIPFIISKYAIREVSI